jgi:hypothetical protein
VQQTPALALFDPLLAGAVPVVEGDNVFRRSRQVGDDAADAGIEFTGMPLDLGNHTGRCLPACRLITEVGVVAANLMGGRGTPDWALEQGADRVLQNSIGRKLDGILDLLGFEELLGLRIGKAGIGSEVEA